MSARALNWAWECVPSSRPAKLVLVALADRADEDGVCWPSMKWLASKCAPMEYDAVRRAFNALDGDGFFAEKDRRRRADGTLGTWKVRLDVEAGPRVASGRKRPLDPVAENANAEPKNTSSSTDIDDAPTIGARIDPLWEALVEAMQTAPPATRSARGSWNAAVKELREAGAEPTLVLAAAQNYRKTWPDISLTPTALAKHWHVFALEPEARRERIKAATCEECGIGGGMHLADCSKATKEVAA